MGDTAAVREQPHSQATYDLCQTPRVRRGLSGVFFFVAAVALAVAAGGWWLQRVAFDTSTSASVARELLQNNTVRGELVTLVSGAAAAQLDTTPAELALVVDATLLNPNAGAVVTDLLSDVHARLIGARSTPVMLTGVEMVGIVRNEVVGDLPPVEIPVETIGWLDTIRSLFAWLVPASALVGLVALVLGIIGHPRRSEAVFGIGVFAVLAAVLGGVLGYILPVFGVPLLSNAAWVDVIPAAARAHAPQLGVVSVVLAIIGGLLVFASLGARRRKPRGWSTPVRTARYSEQRHWS